MCDINVKRLIGLKILSIFLSFSYGAFHNYIEDKLAVMLKILLNISSRTAFINYINLDFFSTIHSFLNLCLFAVSYVYKIVGPQQEILLL